MFEDKLQDARILIIDDVADTVHLLEAMLRQAGCKHIEGTTDPRQAITVYTRFQPDLVLLDLMMPHLDGFEVMAQIKQFIPHDAYLPILVLTANTTSDSKQRALQEGANDFLTKPFDAIEVLLRIKNLLQTRFLHLDLQRQSTVQTGLFEEVRVAHDNLQVLSERLLEAQEIERRHIARELHDEIGTALTAIKINMQAAQHVSQHLAHAPAITSAPAITAHLAAAIDILERLVKQIRELSLKLRPSMLDDFGIIDTLGWYVDRQAQWGGFTGRFTHDALEERLDPLIETACFRITQEALTNVVRHAQAKHVEVELRRYGDELELTIRDDGIGFDVEAARRRAVRGDSIGVLGMAERAQLIQGSFEIESGSGSGTEIRVRFPRTRSACASSQLAERPAS